MTTEHLFWQLGIHVGTIGYHRAIAAVARVLDDEDRLSRLVLYVYTPVALQYNCSWKAVERNLRTVIHRAWRENPKLLSQLAGYSLEKPPKAGEFLEMIYTYMARQEAKV